MAEVKVTYDQQADAAYIYFIDPLHGTESEPKSARMYACDPVDVDGTINLDFDRQGRVIGIEVLGGPTSIKLKIDHRPAVTRLDENFSTLQGRSASGPHPVPLKGGSHG